jgi:sugar-specific transcriptional regulator TrmB
VERAQHLLRELGLTEYEARAYTALVSFGPATAGRLSESAGVPYSRVYDILSKLERRGWVEVRAGRPAEYRARPPAEVMRLLKAEQERKLKEASELIVRELEPVYERRAEVKKPEVWIIRGWNNVLTRLAEMVSRAKLEVLVSLPRFEQVASLSPHFTALKARNIEVRVLTAGKIKRAGSEGVEVKRRENLFGGGLIVDGKEVLLVLGSGKEIVGIWSDEIGLARFAKEYFEYLWRDSMK